MLSRAKSCNKRSSEVNTTSHMYPKNITLSQGSTSLVANLCAVLVEAELTKLVRADIVHGPIRVLVSPDLYK